MDLPHDRMDNDLNATFEACNNFNKKLKDTIKVQFFLLKPNNKVFTQGLIDANHDRKREFDGLKADHDKLR